MKLTFYTVFLAGLGTKAVPGLADTLQHSRRQPCCHFPVSPGHESIESFQTHASIVSWKTYLRGGRQRNGNGFPQTTLASHRLFLWTSSHASRVVLSA